VIVEAAIVEAPIVDSEDIVGVEIVEAEIVEAAIVVSEKGVVVSEEGVAVIAVVIAVVIDQEVIDLLVIDLREAKADLGVVAVEVEVGAGMARRRMARNPGFLAPSSAVSSRLATSRSSNRFICSPSPSKSIRSLITSSGRTS